MDYLMCGFINVQMCELKAIRTFAHRYIFTLVLVFSDVEYPR